MNLNKMWSYGDAIIEDDPPLLPTNLFVGFIMGGHGCKHLFYTYYMSFYDNNANIMQAPPVVVPNDDEAGSLCRDTWVMVVAQLCIFGLMHLQIIACSIVYKNNAGRPTDAVYENPNATAPPPQGYSEPLLQGAEEVGIAYAVGAGGLPHTAVGYKA